MKVTIIDWSEEPNDRYYRDQLSFRFKKSGDDVEIIDRKATSGLLWVFDSKIGQDCPIVDPILQMKLINSGIVIIHLGAATEGTRTRIGLFINKMKEVLKRDTILIGISTNAEFQIEALREGVEAVDYAGINGVIDKILKIDD